MNTIISKSSMTLASLTAGITGVAAQAQNNLLTAQRINDRPNIVLVISEDLSPRFGCYGDPVANTPNIDALAAEGIRFTNVHTMAGVSGPSRSGLITGVFQNFSNLLHMRSMGFQGGKYFAVPPAEMKAYPELMRRAGYFTYCDVKFDYQWGTPMDPCAFSIWNAIEEGGYNDIMSHTLKPVWRTLNLQDRPFFLNYNPQITHESSLFDSQRKELPKGFLPSAQKWDKLRSMYDITPTDPDKVSTDPFFMDTKASRKEIARHYDNIQVMDQQVGQLIKNLKADGLWDNTIFILTTDHGDCLPRSKRDAYNSGTLVPMIIHIPDKYRPEWMGANGTVEERLVSFEDLTPTLLGFAGVEIPHYMTGIDLSQDNPRERKYVFANRGRQEAAQWQSYFVQDTHFQYVRNLSKDPNGKSLAYRNALATVSDLNKAHENGTLRPEMESWYEERPLEEFYDLDKDPNQFKNIIDDPAYKDVIQQFRDTLDAWRNTGNDMTIVPEAKMRASMLDANGQQRVTEQPIVVQDEVNHKLYISNLTEHASIGYSFDGKEWELYTQPITLPQGVNTVYVKAVRYGWKECEPVTWKAGM